MKRNGMKKWVSCVVVVLYLMLAVNLVTAKDSTKPTVSATPTEGERNVSVVSPLYLTFSEQVKLADGRTITSANAIELFTLREQNSQTVIKTETTWSSSKKRVTIKPMSRLTYGTSFQLTIPAGVVKDAAGNKNSARVVQFKTEDLEQPYQVSFYPSDNSTNVAVNSELKLVLNKQVWLGNKTELSAKSIENIVKVLAVEKNRKISFHGVWDGNQKVMTIKPDGNLENNTTYSITLLENKLVDRQGNKNPPFTSSFTTRTAIDSIPPTVTITPAHGAKSVKLDTKITLQFAEEVLLMDGNSLSSKTAANLVQLWDEKGTLITHSLTWNKSKRMITISAKGKMLKNTAYTVYLPSNQLKDRAGNANHAISATFVTGSR